MNNVCRIFARTGTCHYGNRCRFLHVFPDAGRSVVPSYVEREAIPEPKPHDRVWVQHSDDGSAPQPSTSNATFRLVSYNILADALAHEHASNLYPRTPHWCLKWPHRRDMIIKELLFYEPDIICLQEVDHYEDLCSALQPHGFTGVHLQRTGDRRDGCATFWRASRFRRSDTHNVRLNESGLKDNVALLVLLEQLLPPSQSTPQTAPPARAAAVAEGDAADLRPAGSCEEAGAEASTSGGGGEEGQRGRTAGGAGAGQGDRPRRKRRKSKHRVAQGPRVLVANTHILFNTKRGDIKLGQLRTILGKMAEVAQQETQQEGLPGVVSIFGGDFNLVPTSRLYHFIASGAISLEGLDRRALSGQQEGDGYNYKGFLRRYNPAHPHSAPPPPHQPRQPAHHLPRYSHSAHHSSNRPYRWTTEELTYALGHAHLTPRHDEDARPPDPMLATHPLKLRSSYQAAAGHEPSFTTCHHAFMGTVDFVWYTPEGQGGGTLRPVRVLAPPDPRGFGKGMPTPGWPSDHVAMVCDYEVAA